MTAQFQSVKKMVYALSIRQQDRLLNSLLLQRRDLRAHARLAGRAGYISDGDGVDYKKISVIQKIINQANATQLFDVAARAKDLRHLCEILTAAQLERLNFDGLCRMLRITVQSRDATNPTAYVLAAYKNLLNAKDYVAKWRAEQAQQEHTRDQDFLDSWEKIAVYDE